MNRKNRTALSALKRENHSLKRENRRLKHALSKAQGVSVDARLLEKGSAAEAVAERTRYTAFYRQKSFFGYLFAVLRGSFLYGLWKRIYTRFRRYRLVILTIEALLFAVTFLQSGALFLTLSALSAVLLPAAFVFLTMLSGLTVRRRKAEKERLGRTLAECDFVAVFLLPRKQLRTGSTSFSSLVRAKIAASPRTAVLIVSPLIVSSRGLFGERRSRYAAAREEAHHVFLLRGQFYFGIRNELAVRYRERMTVFY